MSSGNNTEPLSESGPDDSDNKNKAEVVITLTEPHGSELHLIESDTNAEEVATEFDGFYLNYNHHSSASFFSDSEDEQLFDSGSSTTAVIAQNVRPSKIKEYPKFLKDVHAAAKKFPGLQRIEVVPPRPGLQQSYISLMKFDTHEHVVQWMESPERQALVERGEREFWIGPLNIQLIRTGAKERVTSVISRYVKPGKVKKFIRWQKGIIGALRKQMGFVDCEILTPKCTGVAAKWSLVVRFSSPRTLNAWLHSPIRMEWLKRGEELATNVDITHVASSFDGFFNFGMAAQDVRRVPPRFKQALVVIVSLCTMLLLWNEVLIPHISHWNESLRTVSVASLNVLLLSYIILPVVTRLLRPWLLSDGFFKWGMSTESSDGHEYFQAESRNRLKERERSDHEHASGSPEKPPRVPRSRDQCTL